MSGVHSLPWSLMLFDVPRPVLTCVVGVCPCTRTHPHNGMRSVWCSVHATAHENKGSACHKGDYGHDREDGDVAAGIRQVLDLWLGGGHLGRLLCGVFSRGFTGAFCAGVLG